MTGSGLRFEGFTLDVRRSRLLDEHGTQIRLRPKSYDLLRFLLSRAGDVVAKDDLLRAVWGHNHLSDDGLVQCVRDVRVALRDERKQILKTVAKRGYLLDVRPVDIAETALLPPTTPEPVPQTGPSLDLATVSPFQPAESLAGLPRTAAFEGASEILVDASPGGAPPAGPACAAARSGPPGSGRPSVGVKSGREPSASDVRDGSRAGTSRFRRMVAACATLAIVMVVAAATALMPHAAWPSRTGTAPRGVPAGPAPPTRPSGSGPANDYPKYAVIVLPVSTGGSSDEGHRALAASLTSRLITDLSRTSPLRVYAPDDEELQRGRSTGLETFGGDLGVSYEVRGSLQPQGDHAILSVSVINTRTRSLVWSDRVDQVLDDRQQLPDEVVRRFVRGAELAILIAGDAARPKAPLDRLPINDLVAKGWGAQIRIGAPGITPKADEYFAEILRRDPDHHIGMLGLAAYDIMAVRNLYEQGASIRLHRAEAILERALAKWPLSMAHYFMGALKEAQHDWPAALTLFDRMIETHPSYAPAYALRGHVLARMGRFDEALGGLRYAMRLSPLDPSFGAWLVYSAQIELERGDDEAAIADLARSAALVPYNPPCHASLAAAFALKGDEASASREVAEVRRLAPWATNDDIVGRVALWPNSLPPSRLLRGLRIAFKDNPSSVGR